MQVAVDVKCMETKFGGHGLSGFRDPNFPLHAHQVWY